MGEYGRMKEIMEAYGITPKKSLGQNFLTDMGVVEDIVSNAQVTKEDIVIEVGPGLGVMTELLARDAGYVAAVEIDETLKPALNALSLNHDNIEIVFGDVLKINVGELIENLKRKTGLVNVKVVANLPYYITTPIVMMFLEQYSRLIKSMTFMVQKEVADRLTAPCGGKEYGAITVSVGYFSRANVCMDVKAHNFFPRPNVDSAVVHLDIYDEPPFKLHDRDYFFRVVRASFCQRRKMLANSLANAPYLGVSKDDVYGALEAMGKDSMIRGEMLSPEEFAVLSDLLYVRKKEQ